MTPPTITPALVKRACAELPPRFGAVLVDKRTNGTMARIGWFLQECGIMQAAHFQQDYATTIPTLRGPATSEIAIPFVPGSLDALWQLPTQLSIVCAHEPTHSMQIRQRGALPFCMEYATENGRADLEAEAYSTECYLAVYFGWPMPDPGLRASCLASYDCGATAIARAAAVMATHRDAALAGARGPAGSPVQQLLAWLDAYEVNASDA